MTKVGPGTQVDRQSEFMLYATLKNKKWGIEDASWTREEQVREQDREQEGYVEPTVDELSGREETITTVVTLPLVKKNQAVLGPGPEKGPEKGPENKADEMSARCEAILIEMKENPKVSRPMLMKKLNLTEKQVRTAIDHIKVAGKAHYEGTGRGGRWVIDE